MGNVMVSLDEVQERLLRSLAREKYGGRKGAISEVVASGVEELARKEKKQRAAMHQLALMKRGIDFGLKGKKAFEYRGEIYE